MIVISSSVVLAQAGDAINANNPRIGYHNVVTSSNIAASETPEQESPASNLGNPATYLSWRAQSADPVGLTVTLDAAEAVDYFAIAKHNLGSIGATVAIQYSVNGTDWTTAETIEPSSDHALICEFTAVSAQFFRLWITPGSSQPSIAVLYIGKILALQRRIYVGHAPFTYNRETTISNGRSESGQFLGRVLRKEVRQASVNLQNITPSWYRTYMEPFAVAARTRPFFWAWRPLTYPAEVGFAWLTNDVQMSNQRANGMVEFSLEMQGIQ